MKYFIVFLLVLTAASSQAQITLEHTYPPANNVTFGLYEVDSGQSKYIFFNQNDTIEVYDINHIFEKLILIPKIESARPGLNLFYFTKKLFSLDDRYEFLILGSDNGGEWFTRIFSEDGSILFSCDTCFPNHVAARGNSYRQQNESIFNTEKGTKLLITHGKTGVGLKEIYSLPGKLPGSSAKSGVNSPSIITGSSPHTSVYPNPSNGQMRIEYKLPDGVTTGEIVISDIEGKEIKKYQVGNIFNDILIDKSDLQSGSYFYKLVTEKGESEAKKIIVLK